MEAPETTFALDPATRRRLSYMLADKISDYFDSLGSRAVQPPSEQRGYAYTPEPLPEHGEAPEAVFEHVFHNLFERGFHIEIAHFFRTTRASSATAPSGRTTSGLTSSSPSTSARSRPSGRWVIRRTVRRPAALKTSSTRLSCGAWSAAPGPTRPHPHGLLSRLYVPLETPLLAAARRVGCAAADGGHMNVGQAIGAFKLFTGRDADPARMEAHFRRLAS